MHCIPCLDGREQGAYKFEVEPASALMESTQVSTAIVDVGLVGNALGAVVTASAEDEAEDACQSC